MTLDEVRQQIDQVDNEIRRLFTERMGLADQVARIKAQTGDSIYKPEREAVILENQSKDMAPEIVSEYKALVKRIMEVSRKYQYGLTLQLQGDFPYAFEESVPEPVSLVINRKEAGGSGRYPKKEIWLADSLEEMGTLVKTGDVDAGILKATEPMEALDAMLEEKKLYINCCRVLDTPQGSQRLVEFSRHLSLEKEHNRLRISFTCPKRTGALGSILTMIADYGVTLKEIHTASQGEGTDRTYRIYLELEAELPQQETKALLFQLSRETEKLQILGSYQLV